MPFKNSSSSSSSYFSLPPPPSFSSSTQQPNPGPRSPIYGVITLFCPLLLSSNFLCPGRHFMNLYQHHVPYSVAKSFSFLTFHLEDFLQVSRHMTFTGRGQPSPNAQPGGPVLCFYDSVYGGGGLAVPQNIG